VSAAQTSTKPPALVRLRPLVYLLGLGVGVVAIATTNRAAFWLMAGLLLLPGVIALATRAARPKRARLTPEGRLLAFFAIGFLVAALNTGTNLLYFLFALVLALISVQLVASAVTFRSLLVRRKAPARVRAGAPFEVEVSVKNQKRFSAFVVRVAEARAQALDPTDVPMAFLPHVPGRGGTAHGTWTARFRRRGEHVLEGVALETRFPFGLTAQRTELSAPQTVLVTPAVFPVKTEVTSRPAPADAVARRLLLTEERRDAVRSLRDYRPGDHPRSIHWRASARRGGLVVKDHERTEPKKALVILDTWTPPGTPPEVRDVIVEEAVSLAASLLVALKDEGQKAGLACRVPAISVTSPDRAAFARLEEILARLASPPDPDLGELARASRRAADRARVIGVTTRGEQAFREALTGLGGQDVTVLPVTRPGEAATWRAS
jgi:uncharacterized protein (DUF58 family)